MMEMSSRKDIGARRRPTKYVQHLHTSQQSEYVQQGHEAYRASSSDTGILSFISEINQ